MNRSYSSKSSRVQSNLLMQNCFVRDVTTKSSVGSTPVSPDTFISLDEEVHQDGVSIVRKVNDYPITPQYVASFADGVDYRKDPFGAVSPVPRKNLGDITMIQRVSSMDSSEAFALYSQLQKRFSSSNVDHVSADNKSSEVSDNV